MMRFVTHAHRMFVSDLFAGALICIVNNIKPEQIIRTNDKEVHADGSNIVWGTNKINCRVPRNIVDRKGNNLYYSSFGLLWKKLGYTVCLDDMVIDKQLCLPIDNNFYNIRINPKLDNIFSVIDEQYCGEYRNPKELYVRGVRLAIVYLQEQIDHVNKVVNKRMYADSVFNIYDKDGIVTIPDYIDGLSDLARNYKNIKFIISPSNMEKFPFVLEAVFGDDGRYRRQIIIPRDNNNRIFDKENQKLYCSSVADAEDCAKLSLHGTRFMYW